MFALKGVGGSETFILVGGVILLGGGGGGNFFDEGSNVILK